jgi:hypothetical protein
VGAQKSILSGVPWYSLPVWNLRILVLAVLVPSCKSADLDLPKDLVWASSHFRYAARASDPAVCPAIVDQLENHLATITNYLGLSWTGGVIGYYKFLDLADYHSNSGCPDGTDGFATDIPDVRSIWTMQPHELVHIYTQHLGHPPALFEEGIAEALSPEGRTFQAPSQSWREILAIPPKDGVQAPIQYSAGGWFVTYLLQKFGPEALMGFYGAAARNRGVSAVAESFQEVYGFSLDDIWSQAQTSAPVLAGVPVWECASGEPIALDGVDARIGGRCDGRQFYARLELSQATTLGWSNTNLRVFTISSCSGVDGLHTAIPATFGIETGAIALPGGAYYVASGSKTKTTTPQTIAFLEAGNVLGPSCEALSRISLPFTEATNDLIISIADTTVPWFAIPQIRPGQTVPMQRLSDDPKNPTKMFATVELCETCLGPCLPLNSESYVMPQMVLRFTNLVAPEGATVIRLGYTYQSK